MEHRPINGSSLTPERCVFPLQNDDIDHRHISHLKNRNSRSCMFLLPVESIQVNAIEKGGLSSTD
ncbi:hypothetical protein OUZ56_014661 [Daphnia magna]|uniref:Uncharacterized protein n=1 Tax=Daphnia magna TaxID=35525 RepID=A0ABR0AKF2_9CRUS|nr:hypothetical protein OUZ56_014661 [Daphnia magna]